VSASSVVYTDAMLLGGSSPGDGVDEANDGDQSMVLAAIYGSVERSIDEVHWWLLVTSSEDCACSCHGCSVGLRASADMFLSILTEVPTCRIGMRDDGAL
jgi:hypothetical protein